MPFPSAACQTCKIRRIKCDEGQPTCQRCTKSHRICLAASTAKQASFSIHLENCYASGETKRPRGPRSSLTVLRPNFDLQTCALAYYRQYHLQTLSDVPNNISGGLSECVSAWNGSGRKCPMVDLALSSMALVIFSRTQRHPPAATEASSRYHRLLQVAQKRIPQVAQVEILTSNEYSINACLLAVLIMGRYEGATHRPGNSSSNRSLTSLQSWSHHDGAMAILKIWSDNLSHNSATFIVKQIRRGLIRTCLLRNLKLPDWMLDGTRFGEHGLELEYDRIFIRIVNLYHAYSNLQQRLDLQTTKIEDLNTEAWELNNTLQDWATLIPSRHSYRRHVLPELDVSHRRYFYSLIVYSYSRPVDAVIWSQYFAARMLINSVRLKILALHCDSSLSDFTYQEQQLDCITQLRATADNLASTIPFCIERFTVTNASTSVYQTSITFNTKEDVKPYLATLVIWPLSIASSLEGIDVQQRLWFRSQLANLGRITGDGVLESAETDQWAML